MIPGVPKASDSPHTKKKKQRFFRKRAGIEPVIGHYKSDHRLGRNFHKGLLGGCHQRDARCGCIQLQKSNAASFVPYSNYDKMEYSRSGF